MNNLVDVAVAEYSDTLVTAGDDVKERAREAMERAFAQLPASADSAKPGDILPVNHYDAPSGGYRLVNGYLEKWVPVYAAIEADSALAVVRALGGSYTPPQIGWRIEKRLVSQDCHCTAGKFELRFGHLLHVDGCGRQVAPHPSERPEDFRSRLASIQQAPSDEYLNGLYPTLGGHDAKDRQAHILNGRSEYRERTRGMVHWGSASKDEASWNGNTLKAIEKVEQANKRDREAALRLKIEAYSKKQLPRKLGEL